MRRVVVLGGGIAGRSVALHLAREARYHRGTRLDVTLLDAAGNGLVRPLLPHMASGLPPGHTGSGMRRPASAGTEQARFVFSDVDTDGRFVVGADPATGAQLRFDYDHLVVALGATNEDTGVPGVREHAVCLRRPADAIEIMRRCSAPEPSATRRTPVVVVGAGSAGISLAAMLALRNPGVEVVLVDRKPRLLASFPRELGDTVAGALAHAGVSWRPDSLVSEVHADRVVLRDGVEIPSALCVWTAGTRSVPEVERSFAGAEHTTSGRLVTDPMLRVRGIPDVWACGDNASVPWLDVGGDCPALGTFARAQARRLARNIVSVASGDYATSFRGDVPVVVAVGPASAVALWRGRVLTGRAASVAWHLSLGLVPPPVSRLLPHDDTDAPADGGTPTTALPSALGPSASVELGPAKRRER